MRILVTGASGLLGSALVPHLRSRDHQVVRLGRPHAAPASGGSAPDPTSLTWDPAVGVLDPRPLEGVDAVVHLSAENIGDGRWTAGKKDRIRRSRVLGTRLLAERLGALARRPQVLVCASAVGFYGHRGNDLLDEATNPGTGFLASVVQAWEEAADPARAAGIRVVHLRIGVVLAPRGGVLARMLPPFRLGLGARLGNGRQYFSWIAIDDLLRIVDLVLEDRSLDGPLNAAAPGAVTNAEFTRVLARVLGRPAPFAVPAWVLGLGFGEMARETVLAGTRAYPGRLLASGFAFEYPSLEPALRHLLGSPRA